MRAELFDIWLRGYCIARGLRNLEIVSGGFWLEVAKPQQAGRYFVTLHDPAIVSRIISQIDEPAVYIEFPGTKEQASQLVPQGWHIRDDAYLMSASLSGGHGPTLCDHVDYTLATTMLQGVITIEARTTDLGLAGSGCFAIVGDWAVFDQILVEPECRRRGLGSRLVRQLANEAVLSGCSHALLVATKDGRALYNHLGWEDISKIVSIISA